MEKHVSISYNKQRKTIRIKAESREFYPQYLKYLLEYLKLPLNATIIFTDKTIKGGIERWLTENKNKEKF